MRILHVASEMYPLIKTGGLADVVGALPQALTRRGLDTRVILPGFPSVLAGVAKVKNAATGNGRANGPRGPTMC